jgi:hypothetical protein
MRRLNHTIFHFPRKHLSDRFSLSKDAERDRPSSRLCSDTNYLPHLALNITLTLNLTLTLILSLSHVPRAHAKCKRISYFHRLGKSSLYCSTKPEGSVFEKTTLLLFPFLLLLVSSRFVFVFVLCCVVLFCFVLSCLVLFCLVLFCSVVSCRAVPYRIVSCLLSCLVFSCSFYWMETPPKEGTEKAAPSVATSPSSLFSYSSFGFETVALPNSFGFDSVASLKLKAQELGEHLL